MKKIAHFIQKHVPELLAIVVSQSGLVLFYVYVVGSDVSHKVASGSALYIQNVTPLEIISAEYWKFFFFAFWFFIHWLVAVEVLTLVFSTIFAVKNHKNKKVVVNSLLKAVPLAIIWFITWMAIHFLLGLLLESLIYILTLLFPSLQRQRWWSS